MASMAPMSCGPTFSRALALETGNGDLEFTAVFPAGMGRARIGAKFSLKDMAAGFEGDL